MVTFEFDGDKYKNASRHQKEWGSKIIAELPLRGDESVLDLGCGDGVLTEQLARRVPDGRVVGIDSAPRMIETAKMLTGRNLTFQLMDLNYLNVENGFDLVFSNATLQWVTDHGRLLRNTYRSLRPDGIVRFNFAGDGNCSAFFEVVREMMGLEQFTGYFEDFDWPWYMPTVDEYDDLIRQADLRDVRVWGENADRYFADADEMTRWLDQPALLPFVKHLDRSGKADFRNAVVEEMIRRTRSQDGRCFETFRRINLFARK